MPGLLLITDRMAIIIHAGNNIISIAAVKNLQINISLRDHVFTQFPLNPRGKINISVSIVLQKFS